MYETRYPTQWHWHHGIDEKQTKVGKNNQKINDVVVFFLFHSLLTIIFLIETEYVKFVV